MERLLTTQEAAKLAGVGPTAIKRWADRGQLNCVRTAGGHRRFRESEVAVFLNRSTVCASIADSERGSERASADGAVGLWLDGTLAAASSREVEARLMQLRSENGSWHRTAAFLGDVLHEMGARWQRGALSIIDEHLLSERLLRALNRIGEAMPTVPGGNAALLTTVEGEEHLLGLALVEVCFRETGIMTHWSGRSTPVEEVIAFIERGGIGILAVSASAGSSRRTVALDAWLDRAIPVCRARDVKLLLGGDGPWPDGTFGLRLRSFGELRAFLMGLQTRSFPV